MRKVDIYLKTGYYPIFFKDLKRDASVSKKINVLDHLEFLNIHRLGALLGQLTSTKFVYRLQIS